MDKIEPNPALEEALRLALNAEGIPNALNEGDWHVAERILYSQPFQEWLRMEYGDAAKAEEPEEPREPVTVMCTVKVPLSSAPEAVHALSAVPISARLTYAQVSGVGSVIATWQEQR